jgi:pilus assembly protein CpaE
MHAGLRDVVALPLSLEPLEASVRAAAQWSRTMRERVAGEESAAGALGGQLIAVAGAKGGVGTTTVALQLALAAVRAVPGRPVCVVDFDLQKGDFRSFLDMPHRRSVVDLVEVADEISVRHLQETLYTHKEGFRVLLAPDDGERAEEVDALAARSILSAVKARHALTIVDLGATVSEASAIGAEIANRTLVVTQPDVVSLRGVKRLLDLWRRLQVREDDADILVIPAQLARTTIPADFSAFEAAVNTGTPVRMEDAKLRASYDALLNEADAVPASGEAPEADPSEPRGLIARLGGERGQGSAEMMGLLPVLALVILALWQVGLLGYTYLLAGHAAREGSRILAVNTTDTRKDKPYRDAAQRDLPKAWRKDAKIEIDKDDPVTVKVRLTVPIVLPGLGSPFKVSDHASTSIEDEPLPPSQTKGKS